MRPLLLAGGRVIDPSQQRDGVEDLLVVDGKVAGLGSKLSTPDGAERIDVTGKAVAPGLIDIHVHLREPGQEHVEAIAPGARGPAAGRLPADRALPDAEPVAVNQA